VFDKLGTKTWEPSHQKSWGPKTCKIWVDFGPLQSSIANISGTDRDIQNWEDMIKSDSSCVRRKKPGELWSTNNIVLQALPDTPKSTFSEDHILAPMGRCCLKFLHMLENDQGLVAHTPRVMGVPPTIFNKEHSKIGIKFGACAPITLGLGGGTSPNFSR